MADRERHASSALVLGGAAALLGAAGAGLYFLRRRSQRPWERWKFPLEIAAQATSGWADPREYRDGLHEGLDFHVPVGTAVLAVDDGVVTFAGEGTNAGNMMIVDHQNGFATRYLHLDGYLVEQGAFVKRGQPIALSGETGVANSGPHLHFAVRVTGDGLNKYVSAFGTPVGGFPSHSDGYAVPAEPLEKWSLSEHVLAVAAQRGVHLA